MKNKLKKRTAFTLAEMMIVMLIFSLISAAIVPSIVTRHNNNSSNLSKTESPWLSETKTNGIFYKPATIKSKTIIGYANANMNSANTNTKNAFYKSFGYASLIIWDSTNPYSKFQNIYLNYATSVSGDSSKVNQGGITLAKNANIGIGNDTYNNLSYTNENTGRNIAIGNNTLSSGSSMAQYDNIAIGEKAHYVKNGAVPARNISIGYYSNYGISSGINDSIALGAYSISTNNSTDITIPNYDNNISIGGYTEFSDDSKGGNIAIGYHNHFAGFSVYPITQSINIGAYAQPIQPTNLVNIGYYAGFAADLHSGADDADGPGYNVNIGSYALRYAYYVTNTVSIGYYSSASRDIYSSVAIGADANRFSSNDGDTYSVNSVVIGNNAGAGANNDNVIIGASPTVSAFNNYVSNTNSNKFTLIGSFPYSSSSCSVYIGSYSGIYGGASFAIDQGYNTLIGYNSGNDLGHADLLRYSILVGARCKYSGMNGSGNYQTCVAAGTSSSVSYNAVADKAYSVLLSPDISGTWANTLINLYAKTVLGPAASMTTFSDRRLKENIVPSKYGIKSLRKINVYTYNLKDEPNEPHIGVIAQELKNVIPEAVIVNPVTGYLNVNGDWIIYTLLQSIKDVDNNIISLKNELQVQIKNLKTLSKRVDDAEEKFDNLSLSNKNLNKKLLYIDKVIADRERK